MERTVIIGGNEYRMRASALIPRLYRFKFGRDAISDMAALKKSLERAIKAKDSDMAEEEIREAQLSALDLTVFENMAWLFCKHADKSIPDDPDEWLDGIEGVFSVYEALPAIIDLWEASNQTTSIPAKK